MLCLYGMNYPVHSCSTFHRSRTHITVAWRSHDSGITSRNTNRVCLRFWQDLVVTLNPFYFYTVMFMIILNSSVKKSLKIQDLTWSAARYHGNITTWFCIFVNWILKRKTVGIKMTEFIGTGLEALFSPCRSVYWYI